MKILLLTILLASCGLPHSSYASEDHTTNGNTINNYSVTNQYSDGVALAMGMGAIQFDLNTNKAQMGVGLGHYNNGRSTTGAAVGFGKRLCFSDGNCGIISITGGVNEGGGTGFSGGFTWAFK